MSIDKQSSANTKSMIMKMPTIQIGPHMKSGSGAATRLGLNLTNRTELRRAILNQAILGKPRAMDPF
jgi:hypothetical protein